MNKEVKEWTERECELLNEMKDRCLNGGKYKDEKAKEKFKMICHLEDYCVQYYQLLDYINQLETNWEELKKWLEEDETKAMWTISSGRHFNYNDVLNKIAELERGKE